MIIVWIITAIVLVVGVVVYVSGLLNALKTRKPKAPVVVQTDADKDKPKEKKEEKKGLSLVWYFIMAMIIVGGITFFSQVTAKSGSQQKVVLKPIERTYKYTLEKPRGSTGLNASERVIRARAKVTEDSVEVLSFTVYYNDTNDTETADYFIDKTESGKLGVWKQRKPASEGHWELTETQTIVDGYCLRVNRSETPDIWANVYLKPVESN